MNDRNRSTTQYKLDLDRLAELHKKYSDSPFVSDALREMTNHFISRGGQVETEIKNTLISYKILTEL